MKRTIIVASGTLGFLVAAATTGFAAAPGSVAVSPTATSDSWTGASYLAGATASPSACPGSVDTANALCDHVSLDVGVTGSYWDTHTGAVRVTISWPDASDNFDLFLYNSAGAQVGSSTGSGTTSQTVSLPNAAGGYEIRVVPVLVTSSGYSGKVSFSSQAIPGPSPTPAPISSSGSGGGTSGSGSGTGSSGSSGSSGSGTGTSGTGTLQGPTSPNYSFAGYGASSPGGLFYAPYPGSAGGGTTHFGPNQITSRKLSYASAYGGPVSAPVADDVANDAQGKPVASVIARTTWLLWLLVSLGVLLLAVVTYVIVEPEGEGGRVLDIGDRRARLPVPPLALAGGFVRALAAGGRGVASLGRLASRRPRRV
jgi:hypothetical protein